MRDCTIHVNEQQGIQILHLEGSLDAYSFPTLEKALKELIQSQKHKVILDCQKLEYISSAALGALIGFARRAREQQGDLKIARLSDKIYNIVELLGFHKILEIHDEIEQAAEKFSPA